MYRHMGVRRVGVFFFGMPTNVATADNRCRRAYRQEGKDARAHCGTEKCLTTKSDMDKSRKAERVEVNKSGRSVGVIGTDGKLIAFYPASIGRTEKPVRSVNSTRVIITIRRRTESDRTPHCPTWPEQPGGRRSRGRRT
jgi:hypothetical protein